MWRASLTIVVLTIVGLLGVTLWDRLAIGRSGHGFVVSEYQVLGEYGYSDEGDRLRFAVFRTWPKGSMPAERANDPRVVLDFLGWPLIRTNDGRMVPVGTDGDVYFFEGEHLKTMKVRMNEHTDTMPLDSLDSLDEVWAYLRRFQIDDHNCWMTQGSRLTGCGTRWGSP